MKDYSNDYIKEKAKANYELIKVLTVIFVAIGAGTVGTIANVNYISGIPDITIPRFVLMVIGMLFTAILWIIIFQIFEDTDTLLKFLNRENIKEKEEK